MHIYSFTGGMVATSWKDYFSYATNTLICEILESRTANGDQSAICNMFKLE